RPDSIKSTGVIIREKVGTINAVGIKFRGVKTGAAFTGDGKAVNTAYVWQMDGMSICHLGALSAPLDIASRTALGAVDILLVPYGPSGKMSPEQLNTVIGVLKAKVIIPIRYSDTDKRFSLSRKIEYASWKMEWKGVLLDDPEFRMSTDALPEKIKMLIPKGG
ncbi:MAG: MBL fold metallo-hydrolase, partial [Anaerolineales bacterium]